MTLNIRIVRRVVLAGWFGLAAVEAMADPRVIVVATANPAYTHRKFDGPKPRPETYVVAQGRFFPGHTADRSIDQLPFRDMIGQIAPELARQQYLPATDPAAADLLIVVHWGTTIPFVSFEQMTARPNPITDVSSTADGVVRNLRDDQARGAGQDQGDVGEQAMLQNASRFAGLATSADQQLDMDRLELLGDQVSQDLTVGSNVQLLGYGPELRRLRQSIFSSEEERTLLSDLTTERYFVILKAYDLKEPILPGQMRRSVWTVHLNMRSPGTNFGTALGRMSNVAASFVGRTTDRARTERARVREGTVTIGPVTIVRERR